MLLNKMIHEDLYHGVYVGEIEDNKDPENWGRLKVRVFEIYGNKSETSTDKLPWGIPITFGGGVYDSGSRCPFLVGATVAVIFEQGNPSLPMIMGGVNKQPTSSWKYGKPYNTSMEWSPPKAHTELAKEGIDNQEKHIVYKTPKGATICIDETDQAETFRIIDRSGQILELSSPVKTNTALPRGIENKIDSDGISYSNIHGGIASIRFVDLSGQEILMHSEQGKEKIKFRSQNRSGSSIQKIYLDTTQGAEYILLEDVRGQKIRIDASPGNEYIEIVDRYGQHLKIDAKAGFETIELQDKAGQIYKLNAYLNKVELKTAGNLEEDIKADYIAQIGGNKEIGIKGNVTEDVDGTLEYSITGQATVNVDAMLKLLATMVKIGQETTAQKLCNLLFLQLFNAHTHNYVAPEHPSGTQQTSAPITPGVEGTHTTMNVEAS